MTPPAGGTRPWLGVDFFRRDPLTCARELIGCELVWNDCAGIIVETEAYTAVGDEACHTFFRPSARAFVEQHNAGAAYVYFNYGMYWLLNVLIKGGTADGFVLLRALEPTRGLDLMRERRKGSRKSPPAHARWLCSGPGKMAQALDADGRDHGRDLCTGHGVGFRPRLHAWEVVSDVRVGITKAADFPWRFLAANNPFVSLKATAAASPDTK